MNILTKKSEENSLTKKNNIIASKLKRSYSTEFAPGFKKQYALGQTLIILTDRKKSLSFQKERLLSLYHDITFLSIINPSARTSIIFYCHYYVNRKASCYSFNPSWGCLLGHLLCADITTPSFTSCKPQEL
jgi:hypothetical protein